jgi:hypothetical protein
MEAMRNACDILFGKPEGKSPLGRPRHRWEGNITIILGKKSGKVWSGCICFRRWTIGGLL